MTGSGTQRPPGRVRVFLARGRVLYFGPVDDVEVHSHHAVQAAVCIDGELEIGTEDTVIRARAALIDSDRPHRLNSFDHNAAVFLIEPESIDAGRLRSGGLIDRGLHVIKPDEAGPLLDALSVMDEDGAGCEEARSCFDRLFDGWGGGPNRLPVRDERIERAMAYIQTLPQKTASLAELAAEVHLSDSRFIHLFTEQVGIPPRRYLLWARLMDALEYALAGANLTAAAHVAGFADSAHFSRTFRSMFGRSPAFLSADTKDSQFVQAYLCTED